MRSARSGLRHVVRLAGDEAGSHLVELAMGSLVMAVAVIGVIGSMASGMRIIGNARQRTAGVAVAQERLERAHNIAYDDVALTEAPTHSSDPDSPNSDVTTDGLRYRLDTGGEEPLIVDAADGGLKHLDDPFSLGTTEFSVHQYVTWVDDAAVLGQLDYKRVVVVVTWKRPLHEGGRSQVTQSTFVGTGSVTVPAPTSPPSPTPTAAPTPTPTPSVEPADVLGTGRRIGTSLIDPPIIPNPLGACAADLTPPSVSTMTILSGSGTAQGYLNSTSVQLSLSATDPCHPLTLKLASASMTEGCLALTVGAMTPVVTTDVAIDLTVSWTIPAGDGPKAICAVFEDGSGIPSDVWGVGLVLDQTPPTVPADLRHVSCTLSGQNRELTFQWSAAEDVNLLGYRLYRSIDSTSFQVATSVATFNASDVTLKSYSSVRYLVRGYDKAGTESADSVLLSYAKNSC